MHSLSIAENIVRAVLTEAEKHENRHVKTINVRIGEDHSDESDSIQFCLEALIRGTAADGASVAIETTDSGPHDHEQMEVTLELA